MRDSFSKKSSGDAPSDQGGPRLEDFSILNPLHPFSTEPLRKGSLRARSVFELKGTIKREAALSFSFTFQLSGDLSLISLPELQATSLRSQKDELWKSTCFEFFVGRPESEFYLEFNFAPSGDFAIYAFDRYREGMAKIEPAALPQLLVAKSATNFGSKSGAKSGAKSDDKPGALFGAIVSERYCMSGSISLVNSSTLTRELALAPALEASLTAVLTSQDAAGACQYWALTHAGDKADFHIRKSFTYKLI